MRRKADCLGEGEGAALVQSTLLFCVGAMTLVGCMQDGLLGDPDGADGQKGTMDLFSRSSSPRPSARGVLWSTGTILVIQGGLTLAFAAAGAGIPESLIGELSGVGGILLLALGLDLLDIRKVPPARFDLVPASVAPHPRPARHHRFRLPLTHAGQQVRPAPLPHH